MGGELKEVGNHSALGERFFRDEGFFIPHTAAGRQFNLAGLMHAQLHSAAFGSSVCMLPVCALDAAALSSLIAAHACVCGAAGLVSMVSAGVHRNGSMFYITTAPCPQLDGRAVAFGRVVEGMEVCHVSLPPLPHTKHDVVCTHSESICTNVYISLCSFLDAALLLMCVIICNRC